MNIAFFNTLIIKKRLDASIVILWQIVYPKHWLPNPHELNSVGRDIAFYMQGAEVQTSDTPILHN